MSGIDLATRALAGSAASDEFDLFVSGAASASEWQGLSAILLAIAFLAWLSRTVENTPALGAGTPKDSPRWAIGWWFVPIAFLWKPYSVVREVWDRLATATRAKSGALVGAWWTAWIGGAILVRTASAMEAGALDLEAAKSGFWVAFLGTALIVAAAVLGLLVVREIQARADERATALGFDPVVPTLPSAANPPQVRPLGIGLQGQAATTSNAIGRASTVEPKTEAQANDRELPSDLAGVLEQLNRLREQGLVNADEYAAKRAEILSRL